MTVSLKTLQDRSLCEMVANHYRSLRKTMSAIGRDLGLDPHAVSVILKQELSPEEFFRGKALRPRRDRLQDRSLCETVTNRYRSMLETMETIGRDLGLGHHTISAILKQELSPEEFRRAKVARYSYSKTGHRNPQFGARRAAERIMRRGHYAKWNGTGYTFEHRTIAARLLGLENLPATMDVHHIDGDKTNNHPNNLAIVTKAAHRQIHRHRLGRLYLWEKEKFGTSLLAEMKAISRKD